MEKNFFQKLFSVRFDEFITPSLASVVYIICMGFAGLFVFGMIAQFGGSNPVLFVLAPLGAFLFLILIRSLLETSVALIKIAENTKRD